MSTCAILRSIPTALAAAIAASRIIPALPHPAAVHSESFFVTMKKAVPAHARHARSKTTQGDYTFKNHTAHWYSKLIEAGWGLTGAFCWREQRRLTGLLWPGFHLSCWSRSRPSHWGLSRCHCQSGLPCCCHASQPLHWNRFRWNHCLHSSRPILAWMEWHLVATACAWPRCLHVGQ